MEMEYDVIIIGTGVAGSTLAGKLPSNMKVAVIDSRGYGGHVPTGGVTPRRSW